MPRIFLFPLSLIVMGFSSAPAEEPKPFHATTTAAVDQAHQKLWNELIDSHGIIHDFEGELPTPEDCRLGRPNAIGWWSPIENGPMFTGLYLPAMCERAKRSDKKEDQDDARRLAEGLMKCATVSDEPGFIARGIGTDGKCHYPLGSDDQTHPWFLGLHAYLQSGIPSLSEREAIIAELKETANVLQKSGWRCPADGAFTGDYRGGYKGHLFRDAVRYLHLLRLMHDVTGEKIWQQRYAEALKERPEGSEKTRLEICAEGYPADRTAIRNLDIGQLWIYIGCQHALKQLIRMEQNTKIRSHYQHGLTINAEASLSQIATHRKFDNNDIKVFGNANWRAVYSKWVPQPTQADAEALAKISDAAKRGERKHYEVVNMRNPLAAAVIVALGSNPAHHQAIHEALRHYDYGRLHMAEFFLAECAFYAMPPLADE